MSRRSVRGNHAGGLPSASGVVMHDRRCHGSERPRTYAGRIGVTAVTLRYPFARREMSSSRTWVPGILHCQGSRSLLEPVTLALGPLSVGLFAEGTPVEPGQEAPDTRGFHRGSSYSSEALTAYHRPMAPATVRPSHVGPDRRPSPGAIGLSGRRCRAPARRCSLHAARLVTNLAHTRWTEAAIRSPSGDAATGPDRQPAR